MSRARSASRSAAAASPFSASAIASSVADWLRWGCHTAQAHSAAVTATAAARIRRSGSRSRPRAVVAGSAVASPAAGSGPRPATNPAATSGRDGRSGDEPGPVDRPTGSRRPPRPGARPVSATRSVVQSGPTGRLPQPHAERASRGDQPRREQGERKRTAPPARGRPCVCGRKPCAWLAARGSSRYSSRASVKPSAPRPSNGRSLNTSIAWRQYSPRDEETEPKALGARARTRCSLAVRSSALADAAAARADRDPADHGHDHQPCASRFPRAAALGSDGFMVGADEHGGEAHGRQRQHGRPRISRPNVPATS